MIVRLPRHRGEIPEGVDLEIGETAADFPLSVLIVDDNPDVGEALRMLLSAVVESVDVAPDGRSGLELAETLDPDVVFLDIGLPDIDGYEVARRIRAQGLAKARVVALTGYGRRADRRRAAEAGFDDHLVKPATFDELTSVLREADSSD